MRSTAKEPDTDECVRFERAIMDFLQRRGHLSGIMRPLWEARIVARSMLPERRARAMHHTAVQDCLEMMSDWPAEEVALASRFLARRGAFTLEEARARLPRK